MIVQDLVRKIRKLELTISRRVNDIFSGEYNSFFKGKGIEVSDFREYSEGDSFKDIDWITTAKQGKVFVKKYHESKELTVMLLIDISASMNFTSTGKTKSDSVLEAVAVVLFSALKNNDKFGVIIFSEEIEKFIPPKKGKNHLMMILKEMIFAFENNHYKKGTSTVALNFLNTSFKRKCVCFLFSDTLEEQSVASLRVTRKKHEFLFCEFFDPFEYEITDSHYLEIEDFETGDNCFIDLKNKSLQGKYKEIRKLKLDKMIRICKENQIDFFRISTKDDPYRELLKFFQKKKK